MFGTVWQIILTVWHESWKLFLFSDKVFTEGIIPKNPRSAVLKYFLLLHYSHDSFLTRDCNCQGWGFEERPSLITVSDSILSCAVETNQNISIFCFCKCCNEMKIKASMKTDLLVMFSNSSEYSEDCPTNTSFSWKLSRKFDDICLLFNSTAFMTSLTRYHDHIYCYTTNIWHLHWHIYQNEQRRYCRGQFRDGAWVAPITTAEIHTIFSSALNETIIKNEGGTMNIFSPLRWPTLLLVACQNIPTLCTPVHQQ